MESEFSGKRAEEIDRLGEEIKRLNSEKDRLISEKDKLAAELQRLKDAPQPATTTQATYPPPVGSGVPPGTLYGSPGLSQVQKLGHFSPNVPPYGLAATQAAYAGSGGQAQGFGSPQQQPPLSRAPVSGIPAGATGGHELVPVDCWSAAGIPFGSGR